tara:strand:+ start:199 stop:909 length:711 start_codon:yes stop_codon:yes gene_type:complete
MEKILVTGANGRFGSILKKIKTNKKLIFRNKKELNILSTKSISKNLKKFKPNYIIHLAGLSRPMDIHEKEIIKSINLNIIGTCNLVSEASKYGIKLIYFSTNYIYPGIRGNYSEKDAVKPWNNYGWSKLGGECAVQMYKNSLILRVCMTEKPFVHKVAFVNVKNSFVYQEEVAKILFKLINKKGVINIGGKSQSVYSFAKKENKNIKKIFLKKISKIGMPFNSSININKLKKILKS